MIEIGRICVKTAGRDAKGHCVIVDVLEKNYVLIDGEVRRRKCNSLHLHPLNQKIDIPKGASHEEIVKEFEKLGMKAWNTNPKQSKEKPKKQRKAKVKPVKTDKQGKKGTTQKKEKKEEKSEKPDKTAQKKP